MFFQHPFNVQALLYRDIHTSSVEHRHHVLLKAQAIEVCEHLIAFPPAQVNIVILNQFPMVTRYSLPHVFVPQI